MGSRLSAIYDCVDRLVIGGGGGPVPYGVWKGLFSPWNEAWADICSMSWFASCDVDGDGALDKDEFTKFFSTYFGGINFQPDTNYNAMSWNQLTPSSSKTKAKTQTASTSPSPATLVESDASVTDGSRAEEKFTSARTVAETAATSLQAKTMETIKSSSDIALESDADAMKQSSQDGAEHSKLPRSRNKADVGSDIK